MSLTQFVRYNYQMLMIKLGLLDHLSVDMAQYYWCYPSGENAPSEYASHGSERTDALVSLVNSLGIRKNDGILEIGCNAGRNLIGLYKCGYTHLAGIEINQDALDTFAYNYPKESRMMNLVCSPAEDAIKQVHGDSFTVVYTMAVFEHIPFSSDAGFFPDVVRVIQKGGYLITIEMENPSASNHRVFVRNYREVFEPLGMTELSCSEVGGKRGYITRLFRKR